MKEGCRLSWNNFAVIGHLTEGLTEKLIEGRQVQSGSLHRPSTAFTAEGQKKCPRQPARYCLSGAFHSWSELVGITKSRSNFPKLATQLPTRH